MNSPVKFWPIRARRAWPTCDHGKKRSSPPVFLNKTGLNFRVRGQFEIKILTVRGHSDINTTYFIWVIGKNKLKPAAMKLVICQWLTSKSTRPRWVDSWAHGTVWWYRSADTLFWQLSIDHNIDAQLIFSRVNPLTFFYSYTRSKLLRK